MGSKRKTNRSKKVRHETKRRHRRDDLWAENTGRWVALMAAALGVFSLVVAPGCPRQGKKASENEGAESSSGARGQKKTGGAGGSGAQAKGARGGVGFRNPSEPFATPHSGEGMWPWADLQELNEKKLQGRGLKLALKEIWTPGKGGLATAVVGLRGCTASFISKDGLLITNHHCAYRAIQRNSTEKRDLLKEGFWAKTRKEELKGYGVTVLVFKNQRDVTKEILEGLPMKAPPAKLMKAIEKKEKAIVSRCEKKPNTRCLVSRENNGIRFCCWRT